MAQPNVASLIENHNYTKAQEVFEALILKHVGELIEATRAQVIAETYPTVDPLRTLQSRVPRKIVEERIRKSLNR